MKELPVLVSFKYMPYFIQKAIIKGAQPLYKNQAFGIKWDIDVALLLDVFRKDGSTYEYHLNCRSNFKRNSSGSIIGWGSALKIQKLFRNLFVSAMVQPDGTIPPENWRKLIGKEVYVLSYVSGTKENGSNKFQMWDILAGSRQELELEFKTSNERGYPRNYFPELMLEEMKKENDESLVSVDNDSDEVDDIFS